ncbi:MAG: hypothetical protein HRU16_02705 [Planctomycetes bacterium]|nr:hypothetical protein [Planctomycetota bacterium]
MRTRILVPLALLMLFLIGCDVRIDKSALSLKYDPRTDTLEGVCINEGIFTVKDKAIADATETIIACLEGKRSLHFGTGMGHCFDFDGEELPSDPDELWANRQVYVDSAHIYLDGEDRLSAVQRFHVSQFSHVLDILNQQINRNIIEDLVDEQPTAEDDSDGDLDQRSIDLMLRSARQGTPWFRLDGNELIGEIPMSQEYWAELRRSILVASLKESNNSFWVSFVQLMAQMSELRWDRDALHFRLGGLIDGVVQLAEDADLDQQYNDLVLQSLEDAGYLTNPDINEDSVRNWLHPQEQPAQEK